MWRADEQRRATALPAAFVLDVGFYAWSTGTLVGAGLGEAGKSRVGTRLGIRVGHMRDRVVRHSFSSRCVKGRDPDMCAIFGSGFS